MGRATASTETNSPVFSKGHTIFKRHSENGAIVKPIKTRSYVGEV